MIIMSQFFSFQYIVSNRFAKDECSMGVYCAHVNIDEISSFDEGSATIVMSDGRTWFTIVDKDAEQLSGILLTRESHESPLSKRQKSDQTNL